MNDGVFDWSTAEYFLGPAFRVEPHMLNDWQPGADGLPVHPNAKSDCPICGGHGVVDAGDYWSLLVSCECTLPLDWQI